MALQSGGGGSGGLEGERARAVAGGQPGPPSSRPPASGTAGAAGAAPPIVDYIDLSDIDDSLSQDSPREAEHSMPREASAAERSAALRAGPGPRGVPGPRRSPAPTQQQVVRGAAGLDVLASALDAIEEARGGRAEAPAPNPRQVRLLTCHARAQDFFQSLVQVNLHCG